MFQVIPNPSAVLPEKRKTTLGAGFLLALAEPHFSKAETLARKGDLLDAFAELRHGYALVPGKGYFAAEMRWAFRRMWMACEHWVIEMSTMGDPTVSKLFDAILIRLQSDAYWVAFNPGELDRDRLDIIQAAIARCYT